MFQCLSRPSPRGSILIYSLLLVALLLNAALALATLSASGAQTTRRLIDSVPSYYAAESCLEQMLRQYLALGKKDIIDPTTDFTRSDIVLEGGATCTRIVEVTTDGTPPRTTRLKLLSQGTKARHAGAAVRSVEGLSVTITR